MQEQYRQFRLATSSIRHMCATQVEASVTLSGNANLINQERACVSNMRPQVSAQCSTITLGRKKCCTRSCNFVTYSAFDVRQTQVVQAGQTGFQVNMLLSAD
jgi:hypothetical protein